MLSSTTSGVSAAEPCSAHMQGMAVMARFQMSLFKIVLSAMSAAELCGGHMQGVAVMAGILLDMLRNSKTPPSEATDACKHLLQLQAEGSPCMEHCAPVQLYLTTQVPHFLYIPVHPPLVLLLLRRNDGRRPPLQCEMLAIRVHTCCRDHHHLALS